LKLKTLTKEKKMNSTVRVRLRIGDAEVEIEGRKEEVQELLGIAEKMEAFVRRISPAAKEAPSILIPDEGVSAPPGSSEQVPALQPSKLSDQLLQLLKSDWGRMPRTLNEIKQALELNAVHYPNPTIAARLNELTKRGKLRRLKKGSVFAYVAAQRT
jgi:hypothetical protein